MSSSFLYPETPPPAGALSTGLAGVDALLGGGLPLGRIVELFGGPASGKTTLALNWIAAAQSQGARCVFVDLEQSLDPAWAACCGVSVSELVLVKPHSGSQACSIVESLLRTFGVDLIVIDSAAALVSDHELECSIEEAPADVHLEFLSRALRRLSGLAERARCCLLFTNQLRLRDAGGEQESSSGARTLSLYAAVRVRIRGSAEILGGGRVTGKRLLLTTIKNKFAEPFAETPVDLLGARASEGQRKPPSTAHSLSRHARSGWNG